jgi:hypothetical protein
MTWLGENSLTIWMLGAVALTMALVVYYQTHTSRAFYGVLAVILATAALLGTSWAIETPREAVERSLYELAATVEANDVDGALSFVAPTAANSQLRKDVRELMPLVRIERARVIGTPEIELGPGPNPTSAIVKCRGVILAVDKRDGMKGGADDQLTMTWVRQGDRWLVETYESQKNWRRAVGR